ncbi:MAG: selenium cofactor biosynthesis protein YqeC [Butyricicoccus sp.]|nr:selenium cofactor biosynthesis protein YqeC [Butyricicoccus sp.]
MRLHQALQISPRDTVAIIGAGGKTTALWRLAAERRDDGALITTSTHILRPSPDACDVFVSPADWDELHGQLVPGQVVCAAYPGPEDKCTGLSPALFAAARAAGTPILYEADGAGKLPAKLHRPGEPVIYPNTDVVLILAGLRALGRPVQEICHRFQLSPRMALTPQRPFDTQDLLETIRDAIRACGAAREQVRILINQADTPNRLETARPVQTALQDEGYFVQTGCLRNPFWP